RVRTAPVSKQSIGGGLLCLMTVADVINQSLEVSHAANGRSRQGVLARPPPSPFQRWAAVSFREGLSGRNPYFTRASGAGQTKSREQQTRGRPLDRARVTRIALRSCRNQKAI